MLFINRIQYYDHFAHRNASSQGMHTITEYTPEALTNQPMPMVAFLTNREQQTPIF